MELGLWNILNGHARRQLKFLCLILLFSHCTSVANRILGWGPLGESINGEALGDQSGSSVSISDDGTVIAIGAGFNDGNGNEAGHVRVFKWMSESWVQLGQDIDGEAPTDYSGKSVALNGDGTVVAIGAPYNDGNGNNTGHVRIFQWTGEVWLQVGEDIDGEGSNERSGFSVSISADGTFVAIGAPYGAGGRVRVFQWAGENWNQLGQDIDGESIGEQSGYSVSLSDDGTVVAIGAPYSDGNTSDSGQAKIFHWTGEVWLQLGEDLDGEASWDQSGNSVSISADGTVVAIGAPYNDGNGYDAGHVRIFEWMGGSWVQLGQEILGEGRDDLCGQSVALNKDGNFVAIGSPTARRYPGSPNYSGPYFGHVRIFEWMDDSWVQVANTINAKEEYDASGESVALSSDGSVVAIGAFTSDANGRDSGQARVFHDATLPPQLILDSYYDCNSTSSTLVDATPVDGFPPVYSYKWFFRPIGGTFFALPASFNGPTMEIACDPSSEGTWRVEVTNEAGTTAEEFEFRLFADADGDTVADYVEINIHGTDPNDPDTDGDGLDDGEEMDTYGTDPLMVDSNSDGYPDGFVVASGFDPTIDFSVLRQSTLSQLKAQRPDSVMATVTNGTASIEIQIEESDDLINWTERETIELVVPLKENETTEAFRVTIGK